MLVLHELSSIIGIWDCIHAEEFPTQYNSHAVQTNYTRSSIDHKDRQQ